MISPLYGRIIIIRASRGHTPEAGVVTRVARLDQIPPAQSGNPSCSASLWLSNRVARLGQIPPPAQSGNPSCSALQIGRGEMWPNLATPGLALLRYKPVRTRTAVRRQAILADYGPYCEPVITRRLPPPPCPHVRLSVCPSVCLSVSGKV